MHLKIAQSFGNVNSSGRAEAEFENKYAKPSSMYARDVAYRISFY